MKAAVSIAKRRRQASLDFKVFLHSYLGFRSTSTLFYGERDAILIDATQLLSDAHKMVAEIIPMRKNLTHIYVSHFHPDHHFGLGVLEQAFPQAKIVALPSVVRDLVFTSGDKLDTWSIDRFGPDTPTKTTIPMPLHEPRLELEGAEILFYDNWEGDSVNNSAVWVPSARVLCATDIAFDDWNVWFIESNVERRVKWRAALDRLKEFDARVIVPGHGSEKTLEILDRAARDPRFEYASCVDWTREYVDFYEEVYENAKTGVELVARISERYPGVKGNDFAIEWLARLLFPVSSPEWFAPLPGRPGKVFLNPFDHYDGDPPRE
jgi:glyoxylase-like metal-dependent hydrolase (beta-lactamase superfamily II)